MCFEHFQAESSHVRRYWREYIYEIFIYMQWAKLITKNHIFIVNKKVVTCCFFMTEFYVFLLFFVSNWYSTYFLFQFFLVRCGLNWIRTFNRSKFQIQQQIWKKNNQFYFEFEWNNFIFGTKIDVIYDPCMKYSSISMEVYYNI